MDDGTHPGFFRHVVVLDDRHGLDSLPTGHSPVQHLLRPFRRKARTLPTASGGAQEPASKARWSHKRPGRGPEGISSTTAALRRGWGLGCGIIYDSLDSNADFHGAVSRDQEAVRLPVGTAEGWRVQLDNGFDRGRSYIYLTTRNACHNSGAVICQCSYPLTRHPPVTHHFFSLPVGCCQRFGRKPSDSARVQCVQSCFDRLFTCDDVPPCSMYPPHISLPPLTRVL